MDIDWRKIMIECAGGYFQFASREDGIYLTVYPPKDGGKPASVSDAYFYVEKKKILDCDMVKINEAFAKAKDQPCTIKVSDNTSLVFGEFAVYSMSSDLMRMEAVFYPPFEGGTMLDEAEVISDIKNLGVKNGIDEEAIKAFLTDRKYGEVYEVAEGRQPIEGKDGYIEYKFNTELRPTPKMNDDGTVDFHSLENVNHVKKGDVGAVLFPEDRGENGEDLLGRPVLPRKVKHIVFRYGRDLSISEDGTNLISGVSGHVTLQDGKVFVSNVMEVVDVDNSTGNIDYDGNVSIKGNVLAGFTVKATGDISVSGIVEGATIIAGGNITFNRGVQGMNRAVIKAGGNIVTKFLESVEQVEAGGNIETDSILHSKVIAKGSVRALGKNGLIIGGEVRSTVMVEAKTIGNEMGTATVIAVGVDPAAKKRMEELKDNLQVMGNNKIQLSQIITALRKKQDAEGELSQDKKELQQKTMRNMLLLDKELSDQKKEYEELRNAISEDGNARIKVHSTAHNGTKIIFGDQFMFIKQKYDHCQFIKERADIKSILL
jgi:hypothetical protein